MICDLCHERDAYIFLEQSSPNGQKRKINLCAKCAADRGIALQQVPVNPKNLSSVFKEVEEQSAAQSDDSKKLCPSCASSLYEIKKTGVAGCPVCYEVFKDEIKLALAFNGIKEAYTGSMPKSVKNFRNTLLDRTTLQAKLDEAIKTENYEKAAIYRDYLRTLEKGCVQDGTK